MLSTYADQVPMHMTLGKDFKNFKNTMSKIYSALEDGKECKTILTEEERKYNYNFILNQPENIPSISRIFDDKYREEYKKVFIKEYKKSFIEKYKERKTICRPTDTK
jgi:hypothetical protein